MIHSLADLLAADKGCGWLGGGRPSRKSQGIATAISLAAILCAAAPAAAGYRDEPRFIWYGNAPQRFVAPPVPQPMLAPAQRKLRKYIPRPAKIRQDAKKEEPIKPLTGPLQIVISINTQRLSLYSNGVQVAQAPISTGKAGHSTPTGVFSVIQKQVWHRSNLYSSAPMPYMQRITWSGVALHAGPLPGYPASHGCIRMPAEFATRLYALTKIGARVIITRDDVAPVEFAHPRLFAPKQPEEAPVITAAANGVKMAQADTGTADAPLPIMAAMTAGEAAMAKADAGKAKAAPRRSGPISIFISRKERKLFVRQNFKPVFEAPIVVQNPELPLGTHVLTAMELKDGGAAMRWTAVSMPSDYPRITEREAANTKKMSRAERDRQAKAPLAMPPPAAKQALDRLELPADAVERIAAMLTPGSSLVISDNGISDETGADTDFVVLTR